MMIMFLVRSTIYRLKVYHVVVLLVSYVCCLGLLCTDCSGQELSLSSQHYLSPLPFAFPNSLKLAGTHGNERRVSLLHYLIQQLHRHQSRLLDLPKQMEAVSKSSDSQCYIWSLYLVESVACTIPLPSRLGSSVIAMFTTNP